MKSFLYLSIISIHVFPCCFPNWKLYGIALHKRGSHTHIHTPDKEKLCSVLRHVPSDTFLRRFSFSFFFIFPRFCLFWVTLNLMENLLTTCRLVVWLGLLPLPPRQSHPPTISPFPGPQPPRTHPSCSVMCAKFSHSVCFGWVSWTCPCPALRPILPSNWG